MSEPAPNAGASGLYHAFWRWHFYAGLLVMPVLMLMALTGGLYLFKDQIDGLIYRPLEHVTVTTGVTSPQQWAAAAYGSLGGKVVQLRRPARADEAVQLLVETAAGEKRTAFVDPHDARYLGSIPNGGVMAVVKRIHSLDILGPVANLLVEVVAGWAIVLVATGLFLWWPRGRRGGVMTIRGPPAKRLFWRDLHAVTGLVAGAVVVFLAVTGMPWSAFWGQQVRHLTTEAGWGRPNPPAAAGTWSAHAAHEAAPDAMPWALQHTEMHGPMSMRPILSLNALVQKVDASGLGRPYVVSVPAQPGKAWTASYLPDRVQDTRTLYLDPATGAIIGNVGYAQFGPAAKAIEWGISVHQGQQFGWMNKAVMLAGCIAVWLLGISAVTMWWKRRPKGHLAAPQVPPDRGGYLGLLGVILPLAVLYPLVGASLAAVLILDILARRLVPALRHPSRP